MQEINDEYISNLFFGKRQFIKEYYKKYLNNQDSEISQYIINRYNDSKSFKESIYRIKYNIEKRPVCEECGKELTFIGGKDVFARFCCRKCANNNELSKQRLKETCIKKYGVDNVAKSNYFKEKYIKHIQEKYNDTSITNAWQAKEVIEKIKQTTLEHYGVINYGLTKEHQNKLKSKEVIKKRENTKRKNHTFNTSKDENESYNLLKEKYLDVLYQYKSDIYPFVCDFYIPSLNLYIECNYHWTHGGHPYNSNNINDYNKLKLWESKNSKFYRNAIITWTCRDVNKRNVANQNNLNYIEFWNIEELKNWLNQ